ncbi:MAG: hypothetical protein LBM02_00760 [Lachnospiraceae bacterium]|nr:hypothetical protein [Lachnospiraceae bacterium]
MRRYIYLGDSRNGGSVFWDRKNDIPVEGQSSKIVSAKKSAKNGVYAVVIIGILIIVRSIMRYFHVDLGLNSKSSLDLRVAVILFVLVTIFFERLFCFLVFGFKMKYKKTTLSNAMHAINSSKYYNNPLAYVMINKKFMFLFKVFIISLILFAISEIIVFPHILEMIVQNVGIVLFVVLPIYYFVIVGSLYS